MKKKLLSLIALLLFLGGAHFAKAQGTTFEVTSTSLTGPGSFLEAIDLANNNPGPDIIEFDPNLPIDLTSNDRAYREGVFHITESVTIDGAGSTVFSNPTWVSTAGDINNDDDADNPGTIINTPAMRFLRIGNRGGDNSDIEVTVKNLNCEQLNNFAKAQDGVSLTLENVTVQGNRSIAPTQDAFISGSFTNLTIKNSTLSNSVTFAEAAYVGNSLWTFAGGIAGNGNLVMENVTMRNNRSAGAVLWTGGTVTIVSSRFIYSGGIQILDSDATIVNSAFDFGFEGDVGYNSLVAGPGANINLIASTVVTGFHGSSPDYNGLPLQAYGGTINLTETAVYGGAFDLTEGDLPGLAYYAADGGAFTVDNFSWVSPVDEQSAEDVRNLFGNPDLLTEDPGLSRDLLPYPQSITPLVGDAAIPGVLIDVIPEERVLTNPLDGGTIQHDVLGNARVDGNGKRNIGAVQLGLAPNLSLAGTGSGSVDLEWIAPLRQDGPAIEGYRIEYFETGSPGSTIVQVVDPPALIATVTGLTNGTEYGFKVRAIFSGEVPGPFSNQVTATPYAGIATPMVTAVAGDREATVSWNLPNLGGRQFSYYSIVWREVGAPSITDYALIPDPATTSRTITGLKNGTNYEFVVQVATTNGEFSGEGLATATPFKPVPPVGDKDCTRSQGYWKTHSEFGPAPYNATWAQLDEGADTDFFLSGQSYYEVIKTPVRNNAYYILAKQYIAAELNFLQGADPSDAQAAFDAATALFIANAPSDIARRKKSDPTRKKFVGLAETLEEYNTGAIGPGYCGSDEVTALTATLKGGTEVTDPAQNLTMNSPNPFSWSTEISYNLTKNSMVTVYIFDAKGSLIKTLENGYQPKGSHKITWNGTNQSNMEMPAGMYFYNIKTDDQILMNKMVIIR